MYSNEDYCCPNCGWDPYNDIDIELEYDGYSIICQECGTHFETPDV